MSDSITDILEEINFCKFMANEYNGRQHLPGYIRTKRALALAELKLQEWLLNATVRSDLSD